MAWLRRALAGLAVVGVVVLLLVLAGLIPAREPPSPDLEAFDVTKTVAPASPLARPDPLPRKPAAKAKLLGSWAPLCGAPDSSARLYKLRLFAGEEALLVWCKQSYQLFTARADGGALFLTRQARFKVRGELPGGAAAGDFDGDGQVDLALGLGARPGVVHRSGAGVFWVRGRAQGGFEAPRALVEAPTMAVAGFERAGSARSELLVLTAGDVAAQRPGELWLFGMQPTLARQRVLPVALDPRGLTLRAGADPNALEAWVLSGQPGRVQRVVFDLATREVRKGQEVSLNLRGAQGFAHEPSHEGALMVRDATSLHVVKLSDPPQLGTFAESAKVGPFVVRDLDGDLQPDVLAVHESGLSFIARAQAEPQERDLPSELKVLDVESITSATGEPQALVLVAGLPDAGTLALLLLPKPPWARSLELALTRGESLDAPALAELSLD